MKRAFLAITIVLGVAAGVLIFRSQGSAGLGRAKVTASSTHDPSMDSAKGERGTGELERLKVPVGANQPQKGPRDAPVTIVVFSDFECVYCGRATPILQQIEKTYGTKVRIVWRNRPLPNHPNARSAAEAAMEAYAQGGSEKFWAMHDLLFAHQNALSRQDLEGYADLLGLDAARFRSALDTLAHKDVIAEDTRTAALVGARSTPSFFVNGRPLTGAKPFTAFQALIDDELKNVEQLKASGVSAAGVYEALMKSATKVTEAARPPSLLDRTVYQVPVSAQDPQRGPADALVTLVMFGDFQCKHTRRAMSTIADLQRSYGSDLRVVWKNNPLDFHDHSRAAAALAMEAFSQRGNEGFWGAAERLFQTQGAATPFDADSIGAELGLNLGKLKTALDRRRHDAKVGEDGELAKRLFSMHTTPLFAINGRRLKGAQPALLFEAMIDEELAKAKARVEAGTARAALYDELIQNGRTEPAPYYDRASQGDGKVYDLPVPPDAPSRGSPHAAVVIQEFSDFQCPFCGRAAPMVDQLARVYGDQVRIVWRNYPLPSHADAAQAAQAAWEVYGQGGNDKFWAYHDLLFAHQNALSRADLERYAKQLGSIDMTKFRAALDRGSHAARVRSDAEAFEGTGARVGTPGFFVNGKYVEGARPFEVFKEIIDREIKGS